jgi:hypothetical protein
MLKAGNEAMKGAFAKIGHKGQDKAAATPGTFEKRVDEISKRDAISRTEAMGKARKEFPDEFVAYQESAKQAA